jgi:hypothetical protein
MNYSPEAMALDYADQKALSKPYSQRKVGLLWAWYLVLVDFAEPGIPPEVLESPQTK